MFLGAGKDAGSAGSGAAAAQVHRVADAGADQGAGGGRGFTRAPKKRVRSLLG